MLTGPRRDSDFETDEFDFAEGPPAQAMSEAQIKFLQWYYRTEDRECAKIVLDILLVSHVYFPHGLNVHLNAFVSH